MTCRRARDRFYRSLEFGTGGMRGRTIGVKTAAAPTLAERRRLRRLVTSAFARPLDHHTRPTREDE